MSATKSPELVIPAFASLKPHMEPGATAESTLLLDPGLITRCLGTIACVLVLASVAGQVSKFMLGYDYLKGLVPLFDLNGELNIPSYFSTLLLLLVSILLAATAVLTRHHRGLYVSKWFVLSFGFLYMSYDEAYSVHERLVHPTRHLLEGYNMDHFLLFAWVVPALVIVLLLALFFFKFVLSLPKRTRFRFILAGAIYVGGAVGVEMLEGHYMAIHGPDFIYSLWTTLEESMEMGGLILFIWSLLKYVGATYSGVRLVCARSGDTA